MDKEKLKEITLGIINSVSCEVENEILEMEFLETVIEEYLETKLRIDVVVEENIYKRQICLPMMFDLTFIYELSVENNEVLIDITPVKNFEFEKYDLELFAFLEWFIEMAKKEIELRDEILRNRATWKEEFL